MINEKRLLDEFIELVSVPCPSLDEKAEAELLVKKLKDLGLEVKVDDAGSKCGGTTGNVWGFLKGNVEGATRLFFEAHMDSVAPTTGTHIVKKDGVLYSDGTTTLGGDDKSGVAAILEAVRSLNEDNAPHGDIQVCFTIAEETGSFGVRYLDPTWIKADAGYCADCGGATGEIYNQAPQCYHLTVKVAGKAAHAGLEPEKGINAIMLLAKALTMLPCYGRLSTDTTLSIGQISGGLAPNIVAPQAEVVIDMRCPDVVRLDKLRDETIAIFKKVIEAGGGTVETDCELSSPAVFIKEDDPAVKLAADAAKALGFTPRNY